MILLIHLKLFSALFFIPYFLFPLDCVNYGIDYSYPGHYYPSMSSSMPSQFKERYFEAMDNCSK